MGNFVGIVFDFVGVALDFAMRVVNFTTSVVDSTTLVLVLVVTLAVVLVLVVALAVVLVLVVVLAVVLVIGFAVLVIGFVVLVINFAVVDFAEVDFAVVDFAVVKIRFVDRVKLGVFGVAKGLNPVPDGGKVRMVGSITSFFVSPVIHHGKFKNEKATQIVAKDVRKIEENRAIVLERASENE